MSTHLAFVKSVLKEWSSCKHGIVHYLLCGRCCCLPEGDYQYLCGSGHITCDNCGDEILHCPYIINKTGLPCRQNISKIRIPIAQQKLTEAVLYEISVREANQLDAEEEVTASENIMTGNEVADTPEKLVTSAVVEVAATAVKIVPNDEVASNSEKIVDGVEVADTAEKMVANEIPTTSKKIVAGAEIADALEKLAANAEEEVASSSKKFVAGVGADDGDASEKLIAVGVEVAGTSKKIVATEEATTYEKLKTGVEIVSNIPSAQSLGIVPNAPKKENSDEKLDEMVGKKTLTLIRNTAKIIHPIDQLKQKRLLMVLLKEKMDLLKREQELKKRKSF